jgi:hypothetical protein
MLLSFFLFFWGAWMLLSNPPSLTGPWRTYACRLCASGPKVMDSCKALRLVMDSCMLEKKNGLL